MVRCVKVLTVIQKYQTHQRQVALLNSIDNIIRGVQERCGGALLTSKFTFHRQNNASFVFVLSTSFESDGIVIGLWLENSVDELHLGFLIKNKLLTGRRQKMSTAPTISISSKP